MPFEISFLQKISLAPTHTQAPTRTQAPTPTRHARTHANAGLKDRSRSRSGDVPPTRSLVHSLTHSLDRSHSRTHPPIQPLAQPFMHPMHACPASHREMFNLPDDLTPEEKVAPIEFATADPRVRLVCVCARVCFVFVCAWCLLGLCIGC